MALKNNISPAILRLSLLRDAKEVCLGLRLAWLAFVQEQGAMRQISDKTGIWVDSIIDDWDPISYQVGLWNNTKLIGTGRLIWRPGNLGFRVSSSVSLSGYFDDINSVGEISGLTVLNEYRKCGFGNAIHFFRFLLAKYVGASSLLATTSVEASVYFRKMGFVTLKDSFRYNQESENIPYRSLHWLNLENNDRCSQFTEYIKNRCGTELMQKVISDFTSEMQKGLNFLPIEVR